MTTLSDKIRAFMKENEAELVDTGTYGFFEDTLADIAVQAEREISDYPDAREIAETIAEARYESREI